MSKNKQQANDKKKFNENLKKKKNIRITSIALVIAVILYLGMNYLGSNNERGDTSKIVNDYNAFQFSKEGELTFINNEGKVLTMLDVELAEDDEERSRGLMYRNKMKENQGMLFIFDFEELQSFWMRNTVLPLDIIFVNSNYEIVKIHKNTTPFLEEGYPSYRPAQYVVEVNAGYTDKFGIEEGNKISWRRN